MARTAAPPLPGPPHGWRRWVRPVGIGSPEGQRRTMFLSLIRLALRQRLLVLLAALGLAAWGLLAYARLPIDAFPDVSPTQVVVVARAPGLTREELETRVTAPVELAMRGDRKSGV